MITTLTDSIDNYLAGLSAPLPAMLRDTLRAAADVEAGIIAAERSHAAQCAHVKAAVLAETDGTGKSVYSNDKARDAAMAQAVAESEECRTLATALDELKTSRLYLQADAEALRVAARLLANRAD